MFGRLEGPVIKIFPGSYKSVYMLVECRLKVTMGK